MGISVNENSDNTIYIVDKTSIINNVYSSLELASKSNLCQNKKYIKSEQHRH